MPELPVHGVPPDLRVLVIDDERFICDLVARALRRHWRVDTETCAIQAVERLRAGAQYAAILSDVMMPSMTGLELMKVVRSTYPEHAAGFLLMTGVTSSDLRSLGVPVLAKPFDRASLIDFVRTNARSFTPQSRSA